LLVRRGVRVSSGTRAEDLDLGRRLREDHGSNGSMVHQKSRDERTRRVPGGARDSGVRFVSRRRARARARVVRFVDVWRRTFPASDSVSALMGDFYPVTVPDEEQASD